MDGSFKNTSKQSTKLVPLKGSPPIPGLQSQSIVKILRINTIIGPAIHCIDHDTPTIHRVFVFF